MAASDAAVCAFSSNSTQDSRQNVRRQYYGLSTSSSLECWSSHWLLRADDGIGCYTRFRDRVRDAAEVPQPPREQYVHKAGNNAKLSVNHVGAVRRMQRREEEKELQSEAVLCVVQHMFEARHDLLGGRNEAEILSAVEVEITVDEMVEIVALLETDR